MAGVEGIFREGQRPHRLFKLLFPGLFTFRGVTFVSKTITLYDNCGHMPLQEDGITPREFKPKCIVVGFLGGYMLNSVGLSNFGARFYLDKGVWQKFTEPFCISFMAIGKTRAERMKECSGFVRELKPRLSSFKAPIALQDNASCPNINHDFHELFEEVGERLDIFSELGIPIIEKFNVLVPPGQVREVEENKNCDAIHVSNTIPFGELPDKIDWKGLFGSMQSPLEKHGFGKGGLSGAPITNVVLDWVDWYSQMDPHKPLIAGGGIMSKRDAVNLIKYPCVSAICVGSVATLRPWRLGSIVRAANSWS